ncbi:nucleoside-diphosphate sugar epimerase/dehydratase [Limisalsivibrio acetivorans]|uniref:nucleoside-diphosphate sugar epimerase/dehydratase n=1 Tax=Limisalsivibrio acetivorans TaxID=1304888 RepID=UPI0003B572B0|nr:nucleoside-diphosphate sugar epimerase/dehydratase [Limisalsivibrio acetivorans]
MNFSNLRRYAFFLLSDSILIAVSLYLAFFLRFNAHLLPEYRNMFPVWLFISLAVKIVMLHIFLGYNISWRFVGFKEASGILFASVASTSALLFLNLLFYRYNSGLYAPLGVIAIDFFLTFFLITTLRVSKRFYYEVLKFRKGGKKAVIIGAGEAGERIASELMRYSSSDTHPVAFFDDDRKKYKTKIHNIPVEGNLEQVSDYCRTNSVSTAIIAISGASHNMIRKLYDQLHYVGVREIKIVQNMANIDENTNLTKQLHDINIEDILSRQTVNVDKDSIGRFIEGKSVLVSGAGGSIGSEIVRQLLSFYPGRVIALDIDETELFYLGYDISDKLSGSSVDFVPFVCDVKDTEKLRKLFSTYPIDIVFHAAAYKHVPLMEEFPEEAVKTNIFGTRTMAGLASEFGVEKFINISTDKAVNPTSIMGATKRMAEEICSSLSTDSGTSFMSVRFGNVLGSRGSAVPIFLEQIKRGGPVTVTHKDMKRYFMTINEAVLLVFQAAEMGNGGEVFVLEMGEPVSIVKLAEDLIRLNNLTPYTDIDIQFTGLRPGEKLFEELLTAEEGTSKTGHHKIWTAKKDKPKTAEEMELMLNRIKESAGTPGVLKNTLREFVPFYKGSPKEGS